MALKQFTIDLNNIAVGKYCRLDQKYISFTQIDDWSIFDTKYEQVKMSNFLQELPIIKYKKGELEDDFLLVNISDQQQRSGRLQDVGTTNVIGSDKNYLGDSDIFVSKLGLPKGYIFINTFKGQNLLGSTEFIPYRIKNRKFTNYLKYILIHPKILSSYASLESGKTPSHKRVNPYDFLQIKIPLIPEPIQNQITVQTEPIEQRIKEIKAQIIDPQEIINKVFIRDLGFDLEKFAKLKKEKFFEMESSKFNTSLIRSTVIQNCPCSEYLKTFLENNTVFLKDIIIKPIKRGKQPEYTAEGVKVIKTLNIQKGKINFEEVQFVSDDFLKQNEEKAGIYRFDLLLTSTGMGRGKFAIYDDDEVCFADSHISIIRFNRKMFLPYFLNYYCQSIFGTEQLKYIEMNIKGTPEIYEPQLNYFQIPDINLKKQQHIIDEIKIELDKQEKMIKQIETELDKINRIIENSIK